MRTYQVVLVGLLAWAFLGVTMGLLMGRRGHDPVAWLAVSVVFGPFVVPLVLRAARTERGGLRRRLSPGLAGAGPVDVLVGIDGSEASAAAFREVERLFGPRLGSVTLATVLDFEIAQDVEPSDAEAHAANDLHRLAATATTVRPATEILTGRPSAELSHHAAANGFELLAVGRRGGGASTALLGSVASTLAEGADVPVMIV